MKSKTKPFMVISDVDGVLTDGSFIYSWSGKEQKIFGAHDNDGVKMLIDNGIRIQFITADRRGFAISNSRILDMNCNLILVPESERRSHIQKYLDDYTVIYIGDGLSDLPALTIADYAIIPKNARQELHTVANVFITNHKGGDGAFLDAALYILSLPDARGLNTDEYDEMDYGSICDNELTPWVYTLLDDIQHSIEDISGQQIDRLLNAIKHANHIVGVGAGRVGYALRGFIMRLNHLGYNASFIGDTNVPALDETSLVIAASTSGETPTIAYYVEVAKKHNAIVAAIVGTRNSRIDNMADINVNINLAAQEKYLMKTYGEVLLSVLFDAIINQMIIDLDAISIQMVCNNHSCLE